MSKTKKTQPPEVVQFHDPSPTEDLTAVDGLVAKLSSGFFELGERLHRIKESESYGEEGYVSWADYVTRRLPISLRSADHYVDIWRIFGQELGIAADDVVAAGWAKLSHVTKLVQAVGTEEEARKWLTLSKEHSKAEIETLVRDRRKELRASGVIPTPQPKTKVKPDPGLDPGPGEPSSIFVDEGADEDEPNILKVEEPPAVDANATTKRSRDTIYHEQFDLGNGDEPLHKVEFYCYQPQYANIMGAVGLCAKITGSKKPGHLWDVISTDFQVSNAATPEGGAAVRLTTIIKIVQGTYEVRIPTVEVLENSWIRNQNWLREVKK